MMGGLLTDGKEQGENTMMSKFPISDEHKRL